MYLTSRRSAGRNAYVTGISLRTIFRNAPTGTHGFNRCSISRLICPSNSTTHHISSRITTNPTSNTLTAVFRDVVHDSKSLIDLELFSIPHLRAYHLNLIARRVRPRADFVPSLTWRFITNVTVVSSFHYRFASTRLLYLVGLLDCYL
jgi:hypothetical protein